MKAYVFPGQGSQFQGMGKDLYDSSDLAKQMFHKANEILGFDITHIMFNGTEEELKQTRVTQPAIFLHSAVMAKVKADTFKPEMLAGHSLGELSAVVAGGGLSFEDGLKIVSRRAGAMQKACEMQASTMAAILGLDDATVELICAKVQHVVVPANYNSPGQLVISGSIEGIDEACALLTQAGAKRALKLAVSGAFHSPLMEPAAKELEDAIKQATFNVPVCPIYQNVTATSSKDPEVIRQNLVAQLTSPVRWTQSVNNMIKDGATSFVEVGPGKVLQGLIKKINKEALAESL